MAGTALHWRTVSTTGAPTFVKQPHYGRSASRATVRAHASFLNPHSILGVSPTADVKEVKRAYRKLALQFHPDVCKSEEGHERFITLTQAYEMLLGRAEGKTDPNHASSSGWDFHDWYWNFRMQRSWEKQQRQAKAAAAAAAAAGGSATDGGYGDDNAADGCGSRPPPHTHAGYKQPEARANLRSQLAGLRHRAAVRANRATAAPASAPTASGPESYSSGSGCSLDLEDVGPAAPPSSAVNRGSSSDGDSEPVVTWSWSWSWDETMDSEDERSEGTATATATGNAAPGAADSGIAGSAPSPAASASDLHHQYTHMYDAALGASEPMTVHDGHLGTVVGAANHAVPFPGGGKAYTAKQQHARQQQQQQQQQQHATTDVTGPEPKPEPFSNPFDAHAHKQASRRRFTADSGSRESVSHQLAGLRRKAAIKSRQWTGAGSGDSADGL